MLVEQLRVHSLSEGGADNERCILRDSFYRAKKRRGGRLSPEVGLVLKHCKVLDVWPGGGLTAAAQYRAGDDYAVIVEKGVIVDVVPEASLPKDHDLVTLDCAGMVLMPGLCDAHVHVTAVTADLAGLLSLPESLVTARCGHILEAMLQRGFTTVRDAGGADFGLAQAVEEGAVLGPRLLFTGHALSQTGGHGDMRGAGEDAWCCGAALRGIGRVCDGDAEVRRAARDELRKGAHCIKVMASGGVASPTDRLTNTQFSQAELRAIVEEAAAAGTYVCAHAYTPEAISRAVEAGVTSIEHGNWLDVRCAEMMKAQGVFLVPTTITYAALQAGGVAAGMPPGLVAKVGEAVAKGLEAMRLAADVGVTMCFGSDLLGELHSQQSEEFTLRTQAGLSAPQLVQQATVNCAALFQMRGQLGEITKGAAADLLLVDGDPLADISVLTQHERIRLVLKEGLVALGPAAQAQALGRLNSLLVRDS